MKKAKPILSTFLWLTLLLFLSFFSIKPYLYEDIFMPLGGAFEKIEFPDWTWKAWKTGGYQQKMDAAAAQNFAYHSLLVRAHNEWDYQVLNELNKGRALEGKDHYLFGKPYVDVYQGLDYAKDTMRWRLKEEAVEKVCNAFAAKNKEVVFLIMPLKPLVYPEKLPDGIRKNKADWSFYDDFINWSASKNIKVIDFQKYFIQEKEQVSYPVFPNLGVHLSSYAETIVVDSLLRYIEQQAGADLYQYHFTETKISSKPRGRDDDTARATNLLSKLKSQPLAYRSFVLDSIQAEAVPDILVLGDSFYWGMFPTIADNGLFGDHEFWYRNRAMFAKGKKKRYSNKQRCLESLERFDKVFILIASAALENAGWDYFEHTYEGLLKSANAIE